MTDPNNTNSGTTGGTTSDAASTALADLQRDNKALAEQLSTMQRERDEARQQAALAAPRAKLADGYETQIAELKGKVQGYQTKEREDALYAAAATKIPGAEPLALRGLIATLAEKGRINRAPDDADAEVKKLLGIVEAETPSMLRQPTSGGGTPGARPQQHQPPPKDPLVAMFGPRTTRR